jgi:hypothetical protein
MPEVDGLIEASPGWRSWYVLTAAGVELAERLSLRNDGGGHRVAMTTPTPRSENAGAAVVSAGCVDPPAPDGSAVGGEAQRDVTGGGIGE